jgi:hypothetical protein
MNTGSITFHDHKCHCKCNANQWISVKDKLPPFGTQIMFWSDEATISIGAYKEMYDRFLFIDNEHGITSDVTHWMHLPEAPK